MRNRQFYKARFISYPDVVTLPQFREMMGDLSDSSARLLIKMNLVKHFLIRGTYDLLNARVIDDIYNYET